MTRGGARTQQNSIIERMVADPNHPDPNPDPNPDPDPLTLTLTLTLSP